MQADLELVLFRANTGVLLECPPKRGVAHIQLAVEPLHAERLVITPGQEPLGLRDFVVHGARRAWVPLGGPQKDRKQVQPHGGKIAENPTRLNHLIHCFVQEALFARENKDEWRTIHKINFDSSTDQSAKKFVEFYGSYHR